MAENKFYDAINATHHLLEMKHLRSLTAGTEGKHQNRSDAESNQAMFEIAETFMDSEDYDQAVKFMTPLELDQLRILIVPLFVLSKALLIIAEHSII